MLGLLHEASWRTVVSDRKSSQINLSVKGVLSPHNIGKYTLVSDWAGSRFHTGHWAHECVHAPPVPSRFWLLTVWAAFSSKLSIDNCCLQRLQTQVVFILHKEWNLLLPLCHWSLLGPLQTFCPPATVWREGGILVARLNHVPMPCGLGGRQCDWRSFPWSSSQKEKVLDGEKWKRWWRNERGSWNLKDEWLHPLDALGYK